MISLGFQFCVELEEEEVKVSEGSSRVFVGERCYGMFELLLICLCVYFNCVEQFLKF